MNGEADVIAEIRADIREAAEDVRIARANDERRGTEETARTLAAALVIHATLNLELATMLAEEQER